MSDKTYRHGQFVWRELMTPEPEASLRFYGEVIGWKSQSTKMPDGSDYTMLTVGDQPVGGLMKPPMPEIPPHWAMYVSVADVDATAKRAAELGGSVLAGPLEAGGFGRMAALLDPTGGTVSAWRGNEGDSPRATDWRPGRGDFCWEQLNTTDPEKAAAFYEALFGWTRKPFPGQEGMTTFSAGDVQVASLMGAPPGAPTHWLTYVVIDALKDATQRVKAQGGKVLVERMEIPTVGAIGVVQDNVGATLGLFEAPAA